MTNFYKITPEGVLQLGTGAKAPDGFIEYTDKPQELIDALAISEEARTLAEANQLLYDELAELDKSSIRDIREWIATQPTAPQGLKDRESLAIITRGKLS